MPVVQWPPARASNGLWRSACSQWASRPPVHSPPRCRSVRKAAWRRCAAQQVQMLRMRFFPDAVVRQNQLLRLSDAAASGAERERAFAELLDTPLRGRGSALDASSVAVMLQQAAVLRADQRAQLWRSLRGYAWPELVEPLLDALRRDPQEDVRFEAAATLAASFRDDARVHTVLESIAKEDPQPLIRMAARRALGGAAEWRG